MAYSDILKNLFVSLYL